ncbi:MAG: sulfate adenylyltransferase [Acidobacteria bacterium]|nr:sulfate adenylyltransferase [Acidobacteriota bacterium]
MSLVQPHGGKLVNRVAEGEQRESLLQSAANLQTITLNAREEADLELIANGAFSPLEGFLGEADYLSVRDNKRLASGLVWSIPVTLSVSEEEKNSLKVGEDVALKGRDGRVLAILHLEEIYTYDKEKEAEQVYRTTEEKHPGVAALYAQKDYLLGGKITLVNKVSEAFGNYRFTPAQLRALFEEKGWSRVVAFQTRNPIHRAHEYLTKTALESVDGLLVHPIVGETKSDDIPADVRIRAYEELLSNYYPTNRTQLAGLPAAMRYAGPREAIFHALIRKNYGASHFIVGRDHAGVGSYYGTYDAQKIFSEFAPEEIGINLFFFENTFYCQTCGGMASLKTCPHDASNHVSLSGTKVREMLVNGEIPPVEFTRPEVAQILIDAYREKAQAA